MKSQLIKSESNTRLMPSSKKRSFTRLSNARKKSDDAKICFEAMEEHRAAGDLVLSGLLATEVTSDKFLGRVNVLKELVTHHAAEEEREMSARARQFSV